MQGEAVTDFSKDPADNSTNYCSLQNLIDGKYLMYELQYANKCREYNN